MISVYVADDHPVYMRGLVRTFQEDPRLECVGSASEGQTALSELLRRQPDVAILDLAMPKLTGLEVHQGLKAAGVSTKVILLTGSEQSDVVYKAMAQGVNGYILKTADWLDVVGAIIEVAAGGTYITPEVMGTLAQKIQEFSQTALTPRELEVLRLLAENLSTLEIATRLVISKTTVKTHLHNIYAKLDVPSKHMALAKAREMGVLK